MQIHLHVDIPKTAKECVLHSKDKDLHRTNLQKVFWPEDGVTNYNQNVWADSGFCLFRAAASGRSGFDARVMGRSKESYPATL